MDTKQLISLEKVLEIEGLVMLINDRREKTPCQIYDLISSKLESLLTEIDSLRDLNEIEENESENIIICPDIKLINNETFTVSSNEDEELSEKDDSDELSSSIEQESSELSDDDMNQIAESAEFEESDDANEDNTPDDNNIDTPSYPAECPTIPIIPPIPTNPVVETDIAQKETKSQVQSEIPRFSLNDKYVFRRELFNFSDEEMSEALKVASEMTSAEEVEDYFYNDLCWDPENVTVRHFITIMTSRFR